MASSNDSDDFDTFLTLLESKLRGPFSSLDLVRAFSAAKASGKSSSSNTNGGGATTYLRHVLAVLPRAEKVTQLRCLVGLLGLEPEPNGNSVASIANKFDVDDSDRKDESIDAAILRITQAAQEAPVFEEWVRIVGGLVQTILFPLPEETNNKSEEEKIHARSLPDDDDDTKPKGEEAQQLLNKTCAEILERVRKALKETSVIDEDSEHLLAQSDADPLLLTPYRYALLRPNLLSIVLPELSGDDGTHQHHHFVVNTSADILSIDSKLEQEKAREEREHHHRQQQQQSSSPGLTSNGASAKATNDPKAPDFPGFVRTSHKAAPASTVAAAQQRPKSSMFMPTKKPPGVTTMGGRGGGATAAASFMRTTPGRGGAGLLKPVVKPGLHQRKAGAAQALLAKGRARARLMKAGESNDTLASPPNPRAAASESSTTAGLTGAAAANASHKSKMKMIDVTEVQGLESKKILEQEAALHPPKKLSTLSRGAHNKDSSQLSGHKRSNKSSSAPASNIKLARQKTSHTDASPSTRPGASTNDNASHAKSPLNMPPDSSTMAAKSAGSTNAMAAAALLAYQQSQQQNAAIGRSQQADEDDDHSAQRHGHGATAIKQQDWRQLLQEKSNRLTDDDRTRLQQFFDQQHNPTPELPSTTYKMKLHEERTTDAETGHPIKVTLYLELNYDNYTVKQTKKAKRY